jgi:hypothetical protein
MEFLSPGFLWALLALAIPVIIHLFYFRRFKKVYFTNVRFLKEVKEETSARRRLRNFLVLLARLLALAFLVFAFAQPFIPQTNEVKKGEKNVSVFIDNSFSMSALSEDVPLIEKAKQRAREIIAAYQPEDRFQILTNDFEGRHQFMVSQEDALSFIDDVKISPAVKGMSQVLERQLQAINAVSSMNKNAYLISDFQRNVTDFENFQDTTLEVNLIPLQSVQEQNITLDSAWFDAPVQMINQTNTLVIQLKNYSNQDAENVRLSLRHEGQTKPIGTMSIPAGATVTDTVNMTIQRTGWHEAELAITDYPVQFDDKYYFTFNVDEEIDILVLNETGVNKYLNASFEGISYFKITNQSSQNINYSSFPDYNLIVLNGLNSISTGLASELNQYVFNGGNVLTFPGPNANLESYRSYLSTFPANELQAFEQQERRVANINTEEFIFKDVFENAGANIRLPVTQGNYGLTRFASRKEEPILRYRDGSVFIAKYARGQGHLYLATAPLEENYNDLVRNGDIFIPMLYKMAISTAKESKIAYTIGRDELIEADNRVSGSELVYKMKGRAEEFIPEQRIIGQKVLLGINGQIKEAGFYDLFLEEGNVIDKYGFNFSRRESELAYYNPTDLASLNTAFNIIENTAAASLTPIIGERSQGIPLWRWCIIMALIFLGVEALLLRFWKV